MNIEDDYNHIQKISLNFRRGIIKEIINFLDENKNLSEDEIFLLFSICFSSVIAQSTNVLFKKDIQDVKFSYIDSICEYAKGQLKIHDALLEMKIN